MKKVIYYPAAAVCGYCSFSFAKAALEQTGLPIPARIMLAAFGASMGVGSYACVQEANNDN